MSTPMGEQSGRWIARPICDMCLAGAVIAAPFQQAFTIDVGFPLKISEVLLLIAAPLFLLVPRAGRAVAGSRLLGILALIVVVSAGREYAGAAPAVPSDAYPSGYDVDLLSYLAYGLLVLFAAYAGAARLGAATMRRLLLLGLYAAAAYCVVQALAWNAGTDVLDVVGGTVQEGTAYGPSLPRNGPFLEGNYLGLFAGIALFVAAREKQRRAIVVAVALLLYSQSTSAVVSVTVGALAAAMLRPRSRALTTVGALLIGAGVLSQVVSQAGAFRDHQLAKVGLEPDSAVVQVDGTGSISYSRELRGTASSAGFRMGLDHPFAGVGPGRYAMHFQDYADFSGLHGNVQKVYKRPIANNGYAQVAAECGLIALGVIGAFFVALLQRARGRSVLDVGLVVFLAVAFNAVSAWTNLPLWFGLGALAASGVPVASEDDELVPVT